MNAMIKSYRMLILPRLGFKAKGSEWTNGKLKIKSIDLNLMNEEQFLEIIFKSLTNF